MENSTVSEFRKVQDSAFELFKKKNADYGNAFEVIPRLLDNNKRCAVLIDGPKGLHAIELAMKLLVDNENLLWCMFHDVYKDAYPARDLLDKYFPDAIYSWLVRVAPSL